MHRGKQQLSSTADETDAYQQTVPSHTHNLDANETNDILYISISLFYKVLENENVSVLRRIWQ